MVTTYAAINTWRRSPAGRTGGQWCQGDLIGTVNVKAATAKVGLSQIAGRGTEA